MDYFHETIKVPDQFLAWVYLQSENCITDVKKHWHRSLEISYIIKGSCLFEINGHELEAHPHDILLINSCDIHGCHTNYHSESEMLSIIFPYSFLMAVFPTFNNYRYIVEPSSDAYNKLESAFAEIYPIFRNRSQLPLYQLPNVKPQNSFLILSNHRSILNAAQKLSTILITIIWNHFH